MQLNRRTGKARVESRKCLRRNQLLRFIVIQIGSFLGHQALEHIVNRFEQRRTAAEIGLQIDDLTVTAGCLIRSASVQKLRRLCQSKTIDALFHITDAKQIPRKTGGRFEAFTADQRENRVLHLVDVLIFVHQHMLELVMKTTGQR